MRRHRRSGDAATHHPCCQLIFISSFYGHERSLNAVVAAGVETISKGHSEEY